MLTWVFRGLYVVGAAISGFAAFRYNRRTGGAWRDRPAGRMLMMLVLGLFVAFTSVALRVVTILVRPYAPWLDEVVLFVTTLAVLAVIFGLFQFMLMVERQQPDYSSRKEGTPPMITRLWSLVRYPTLLLQLLGALLTTVVSLNAGMTAAEAGALLFAVQVVIGAVNAWAVRPIAPAAFTALVPALAGLLTAFHVWAPSTQTLDALTSLVGTTFALLSSLLTTPAYDPAPPGATVVTRSGVVHRAWRRQGHAVVLPDDGDGEVS